MTGNSNDNGQDLIDPLVGLSPQLLGIFAIMPYKTLQNEPLAAGQESELRQALKRVDQKTPKYNDMSSSGAKILNDCARAYSHAAYVYVLCRYERSVQKIFRWWRC